MNKEQLYRAIGKTDPELLERSEHPERLKQRFTPAVRILSMAAMILLAVGVVYGVWYASSSSIKKAAKDALIEDMDVQSPVSDEIRTEPGRKAELHPDAAGPVPAAEGVEDEPVYPVSDPTMEADGGNHEYSQIVPGESPISEDAPVVSSGIPNAAEVTRDSDAYSFLISAGVSDIRELCFGSRIITDEQDIERFLEMIGSSEVRSGSEAGSKSEESLLRIKSAGGEEYILYYIPEKDLLYTEDGDEIVPQPEDLEVLKELLTEKNE